MILLGGRLPEIQNKRIRRISGLKSGRGRLRIQVVVTREFLKQYLTDKQNRIFTKWSLTGRGRYEGVDCTFINFAKSFTM